MSIMPYYCFNLIVNIMMMRFGHHLMILNNMAIRNTIGDILFCASILLILTFLGLMVKDLSKRYFA